MNCQQVPLGWGDWEGGNWFVGSQVYMGSQDAIHDTWLVCLSEWVAKCLGYWDIGIFSQVKYLQVHPLFFLFLTLDYLLLLYLFIYLILYIVYVKVVLVPFHFPSLLGIWNYLA